MSLIEFRVSRDGNTVEAEQATFLLKGATSWYPSADLKEGDDSRTECSVTGSSPGKIPTRPDGLDSGEVTGVAFVHGQTKIGARYQGGRPTIAVAVSKARKRSVSGAGGGSGQASLWTYNWDLKHGSALSPGGW